MSFTDTESPAADPTPIREGSGVATVIDRNTVVDGTLSTSHDLRVEGRVTGNVICNGVVHIGEGAEIDATVEASGIVVSGTLSGTVTCHGKLEIRSTGVVRGRVETGRLIVVEGAVYEGQLRMDAPVEEPSEPEPEVEEADPEPATVNPTTGSYSFLRNFTPGATSPRAADDVLPGSSEDDEPD